MQNKIELHIHMDGSLSEKTLNTLVNKNYQVLTDEEKRLFDARKLYKSISANECSSLADYLKKFDLPCRLLQQPEDIAIAFENLVVELANQGVVYAEIRFAPQLHSVGIPVEDKLEYERQIVKYAIWGMHKGMCGKKIITNLILCCMRNLPDGDNGQFANERNLYLADEFFSKGVCAIDLAGAEARDATSEFESIFREASDYNIPFTIHAGEAGSPEWLKVSLESAIKFGAKRIGHGVGLKYFPELQEEVKANGIALECCLKSNTDTNAVFSIQDHPIKTFFDNGIRVTLNTDNMTVSNTSLSREFAIAKTLGFTEKDIQKMQEYAFEAAFMTDSQRRQIAFWNGKI